MADYVQKLRDDLVEQFKGKPVIDALMEAVGDELNEVRQFYEDLRDKRNIQTAVGKQLDGIGDNAVLTALKPVLWPAPKNLCMYWMMMPTGRT